MSIMALAWAKSQRVGSPTGKILLMCLADYADDEWKCWPSQKTISQEAEVSERATREWLEKLEAAGFISRTRRTRKDGSRTSDLIHLNVGNRPEPGRKSLPAKSAARPGTTSRGTRHQLPGNEPSLEPLLESSSLPSGATASGGAGGGFQKLWDQWPEKDRPDFREAAKTIFEKLPTADQAIAIAQTPAYLRNCAQQKSKALMIPYLKNRTFEELLDGPAIDADGRYRITPDRAEWNVWLASFGTESARKRVAANGYLLTKTRLPESQVDYGSSGS
jgi:hypothetical protein